MQSLNIDNNVFPEMELDHAFVDGKISTSPKDLFEAIGQNVSYTTEIEEDDEELKLLAFNSSGDAVTFKFMFNEENSHVTHCRIEYVASNTTWEVPLPVAYDIKTNVWEVWEPNIDLEKTKLEDVEVGNTLNAFVSRSVYYVNRVFNDEIDFDTVQNDLILAVSSFLQNKPKEIDNSTIFAKLFMTMTQVARACGITDEDVAEGLTLVQTLHKLAEKELESDEKSAAN